MKARKLKRIHKATLCRAGEKAVGMAASRNAMTLTPSAHDLSDSSLVDPAVDELTDMPVSFPIANPDKP